MSCPPNGMCAPVSEVSEVYDPSQPRFCKNRECPRNTIGFDGTTCPSCRKEGERAPVLDDIIHQVEWFCGGTNPNHLTRQQAIIQLGNFLNGNSFLDHPTLTTRDKWSLINTLRMLQGEWCKIWASLLG